MGDIAEARNSSVNIKELLDSKDEYQLNRDKMGQ